MPKRIRFSRFELLATERQLLDDGRPVALGSRAFDLLHALIERRGRLVGKAELLDVVWPGLVIEEANLPVQVSTLRRVIGPQAIATVPGLGYRFAVALDDTDDTGPPRPMDVGPEAMHTNVPAAAELLYGRDVEFEELTRCLPAHRLVTVVGAGGVGKTRLAQAVARGQANHSPRRVWWVDLSALSSAGKIAPAIANAAGLQLGDGDAVPVLVSLLAQCDMLLVLDNCEHLAADVAAVVAALLAGAERVRVLATSQVALKVAGEQIYPLAPLAVAPAGTPLGAARHFGALQLLEIRAQAVDPRFHFTDENVQQGIDLCRRLDGIPLAIEMAAARVATLGMQGLDERLGERLNLLRSCRRDLPTRQQTLRATLDWSHALLDADEQAVLRRLAVFAGSFRLDVAVRVAAGPDLDEWRVLDALTGLVEKSLVKLERLEPPRYRLFDTMRLYATERLAGAGEWEATLRRHGAAMAQLSEEAEGSELAEAAWLRYYGPDYDDLSEGFERACRRREADCAAVIVGALRLFDRVRGMLTHSRQLVEAAYEMLPHASPLGQARLCNVVAYFGWIAVDHTSRLATAGRAVTLWRSQGHPRELHQALSRAAMEYGRVGAFAEADGALSEAREIEQAAWPPKIRKLRAFAEGFVAGLRGDARTFRQGMQEALMLSQEAGEERYAAHARVELARAALMAGDVDEAVMLSRRAVEKYSQLDQAVFHGLALVTLCTCLLAAGDLAGARAAAAQALPLLERSEARVFLLSPLALFAALTGACETAGLLLGFAEKSHQTIENPRDKHERYMDEQATAAMEASIDRARVVQLRDAGAGMSGAKMMALTRALLADPMDRCPEKVPRVRSLPTGRER